MRSEDDLRAAFTAKAGEAPAADRVLRAVRRAEARPPERRRWLGPAIGVAAAAAVGVPLALAISHSSSPSKKSADSLTQPAASPPAAQAPSAAGGAGGARTQESASAGLAVCRPGDVTVTLRREGVAGRLVVTSHGPPCRLARVPTIAWPAGSTTYGSTDKSGGKAAPTGFGVLPASGTASAAVTWTGCGLPDGTVATVDWGSGPVAVTVAAAPSPAGCAKTPAPTDEPLRVGPLTGLS